MKQTKKLTRNQREFLKGRHVGDIVIDNPFDYRLVEETNKYIKIQGLDGNILEVIKASR